MITLPAFVMASNRAELLSPMILQLHNPYCVGKVWLFTDELKFVEFVNTYQRAGITPAAVPGYMIAITFEGTIMANKIRVESGIVTEVKVILRRMVDFFTQERLVRKPGYYQRHKL